MADEQMAMMAEKLREVQSSSAAQIMALRADRDTRMEIARIESDTRIRVAEISRRADAAIDDMQGRLSESTEPTNQQNEVRT
jgi:transcriptional regulator